jgi:hypothetical protein
MKDSVILVTNNGMGTADLALRRKLAAKYFELLLVCSTCIDYFGIRDAVEVGIIGGMPDIMGALKVC